MFHVGMTVSRFPVRRVCHGTPGEAAGTQLVMRQGPSGVTVPRSHTRTLCLPSRLEVYLSITHGALRYDLDDGCM
jgi:hypothetical protein